MDQTLTGPHLTRRSYTKAIEVSIRKDAVFFSNRAACECDFHFAAVSVLSGAGYTNFSPPEYEKCVADCDEALKLDHT
jgi:import receptor subunit TOM70